MVRELADDQLGKITGDETEAKAGHFLFWEWGRLRGRIGSCSLMGLAVANSFRDKQLQSKLGVRKGNKDDQLPDKKERGEEVVAAAAVAAEEESLKQFAAAGGNRHAESEDEVLEGRCSGLLPSTR